MQSFLKNTKSVALPSTDKENMGPLAGPGLVSDSDVTGPVLESCKGDSASESC
jgi:hypothetical protein